MNNELLQTNTERHHPHTIDCVDTKEMCKLSLDPGGGEEQMNLWSRIILVECFVLQDIPACGLEHGTGGVPNILYTLYYIVYVLYKDT